MKKNHTIYFTLILVLFTGFSQAQTQITFYTNKGTFVAEMYDTLQPITAGNFINLVKKKFYDKVIFHRVIDGFMIQGGDPTGTGSGGPGYSIPDEFDDRTSNVQKALAMANSGPNTGGSQFFINLVDNKRLDPNYPVFGIVISNFSVVQAIGKVATNSKDKPLSNVIMDSVRITKAVITSIDEPSGDFSQMHVFPNPLTEESVIRIAAANDRTTTVSLYNQQGKLMARKQKKLVGGMNTISWKEIQEGELSGGLYHLVLTDGNSIIRQKVLLPH